MWSTWHLFRGMRDWNLPSRWFCDYWEVDATRQVYWVPTRKGIIVDFSIIKQLQFQIDKRARTSESFLPLIINCSYRESKGKSKSSRRSGESIKKSDTVSKDVSKRDDKKQSERKDDSGIAALDKKNKSSAKDGENKSHSVSKQQRKTKSKRDAQSTKKGNFRILKAMF